MSDEKLRRWIEFSKNLPTTGKAALAVVMKGGLLLAISRENDREDFGLLGGKLEPGEMWLTGLVREVHEETGLEVISAELVHEGESDDGHLVRSYRCLLNDYEAPVKESWEGIVRWVRPEEVVKGCFARHNRKVLSTLGLTFP